MSGVTGPQRARLDAALSGADPTVIHDAAWDWRDAATVLRRVSQDLRKRADDVRSSSSGLTIEAASQAFRSSSEAMDLKARELLGGSDALSDAASAIEDAHRVRAQFADLSAPTPPTRGDGPAGADDMAGQIEYQRKRTAYLDAVEAQEEASRRAADAMDRQFRDSAVTMRAIHGEQPGAGDGTSNSGGTGGEDGSGGPGGAGGPGGGQGPIGQVIKVSTTHPPRKGPTMAGSPDTLTDPSAPHLRHQPRLRWRRTRPTLAHLGSPR